MTNGWSINHQHFQSSFKLISLNTWYLINLNIYLHINMKCNIKYCILNQYLLVQNYYTAITLIFSQLFFEKNLLNSKSRIWIFVQNVWLLMLSRDIFKFKGDIFQRRCQSQSCSRQRTRNKVFAACSVQCYRWLCSATLFGCLRKRKIWPKKLLFLSIRKI